MEAGELLSAFRTEVRDGVTPYLWSDTEIYGYIADAQRMFCRLSGGISDASSAATQVAVLADEKFANLDPKILKVRAAYLSSNGRQLQILNYEDLEFMARSDDYGYQNNSSLWFNEAGTPEAVILGVEQDRVRLAPIPTANDTIELVVYRLPLIDPEESSDDLEIQEHHHRHLLLWMKSLAHMKQDAETFDRARSEAFAAQFYAYCDESKAEKGKREHKYRTIGYGGL